MRQTYRRELLSGWGRAAPSVATVARPRHGSEIAGLISPGAAVPGARIARGLGRSYGDAAQCAGGLVLDCTHLDSVIELDEGSGTLRCEAGASFDALLKLLVPRGYFLPVTPGTRFVTVGGAIASDVHGKNHHVDGSLGAHVDELVLVAPTGSITCGPGRESDVFAGTCGGMGLTGVISEATMRLIPIESSRMLVDTERAEDLDSCMALLSEERERFRYSVAWLDALASGRRLGRAVVTRGDHARVADLPSREQRDPLAYGPRAPIAVPMAPPVSLLNHPSISAFNEMWFRKSPRRRTGHLEQIPGFFHPLDGLGGWNLLYGPRGFTQYQFVVPFGAESVVKTVLERLSKARVASFLAVLKCFGPQGSGYLSFPSEGWTLALDIPLGSRDLVALLDSLDLIVAEAGGRIYLSKDSRLRPELLKVMYPRLSEWAALRDRLDPAGLLSSDLSRRLGLCGSDKAAA
ncbi:MAG: FAD-binding oxidoreductase [Actinomycetota bacterium]|nr:FAD-binding oxidoreductase [Actinomycetota bacterium]